METWLNIKTFTKVLLNPACVVTPRFRRRNLVILWTSGLVLKDILYSDERYDVAIKFRFEIAKEPYHCYTIPWRIVLYSSVQNLVINCKQCLCFPSVNEFLYLVCLCRLIVTHQLELCYCYLFNNKLSYHFHQFLNSALFFNSDEPAFELPSSSDCVTIVSPSTRRKRNFLETLKVFLLYQQLSVIVMVLVLRTWKESVPLEEVDMAAVTRSPRGKNAKIVFASS